MSTCRSPKPARDDVRLRRREEWPGGIGDILAEPAKQFRPLLTRILASFGRSSARAAAAPKAARDANALCHALMSERGEVSGIRIAREVLDRYRGLDAASREHFFSLLAEDFGQD